MRVMLGCASLPQTRTQVHGTDAHLCTIAFGHRSPLALPRGQFLVRTNAWIRGDSTIVAGERRSANRTQWSQGELSCSDAAAISSQPCEAAQIVSEEHDNAPLIFCTVIPPAKLAQQDGAQPSYRSGMQQQTWPPLLLRSIRSLLRTT